VVIVWDDPAVATAFPGEAAICAATLAELTAVLQASTRPGFAWTSAAVHPKTPALVPDPQAMSPTGVDEPMRYDDD